MKATQVFTDLAQPQDQILWSATRSDRKEEGLNWRLADRHKHKSTEGENYIQEELQLRGNERRH
jgi:hypothetical protein